MEGRAASKRSQEESWGKRSVKPFLNHSDNNESHGNEERSKAEKKARKAGPSPSAHLVPLPTIETIMTYPSLPRPLYDSLVRGEPPAQTYNTVIHSPKPPTMRPLDPALLQKANFASSRRRTGARSRSSTGSSTASSASAYSAGGSTASSEEESSSSSDISEPESPAMSMSSSAKATVSTSPSPSPRYLLFPPTTTTASPRQSPIPSPTNSTTISTDTGSIIDSYSSRSSSPAQSFHSTLSTLSTLCDSASSLSAAGERGEARGRSAAPSPASSAYPSPPSSPGHSRASSSSGEEFMYPSPPPSPSRTVSSPPSHSRSYTFPAPSPPTSSTPALRGRSTSLSGNQLPLPDPGACDLGEQELGGGMLYEDDEDMDWSMNGGEVVFGAAGIAMSPRAMRRSCCGCGGGGLGLYVIDEVSEPEVEH